MTVARSQLVDVDVTRYYHCISRCVRRAHLCGEGFEHRKQWIEERLETLSGCFAVSVCGFAVMDNHLHVLVRLDADEASSWSAKEVVRRWIVLEGFSLGSYLLLVDYTSRLCRQGKARVSREVALILDRLGSSADAWAHRILAGSPA
jgi:hypothetical protein